MFEKSPRLYDVIYSFKNYAGESQLLHGLIGQYKRSTGSHLLDVACGTGQHLVHLQSLYTVEGLDLDDQLLAVAAERLPGVPLHHADMIKFDLGRTFDVVVNLFSAIGYVRTLENLNQTVATMARHLSPGGVLMVEPWLYPDFFKANTIHARYIDEPDLKIARLSHSTIENGVSVLNFRYLIGTPDGIDSFEERHELGLWTPDQYRAAFNSAGLETHYHMAGLDGRGMWIGVKP